MLYHELESTFAATKPVLEALREAAGGACMREHTQDSDCAVGMNGTCEVCGVLHGVRPLCNGRGFHADTCEHQRNDPAYDNELDLGRLVVTPCATQGYLQVYMTESQWLARRLRSQREP